MLDRRGFLTLVGLPSASSLLSAAPKPKQSLVYIGTYTGPQSQGIYAFRFDAASGKLTPLGVAAETRNPSFVAVHPSGKFLYAANETNNGAVTAYSLDAASGKLTELNTVPSHGGGPCYVTTDKTGKVAMVANYGGGSFASYPISVDGHLGEAASKIQDSGSGPVRNRQEGPHAHSINPSPDNRFVIGADLGLDKLLIFKLDSRTGKLTPNSPDSALLKPGSGPRHFAFHPKAKFAYVINELASTITGFTWDRARGALTEIQTTTTLPSDFAGQNSTAHIAVHPNGKFVYGSNRGHDSIAVFAVDPKKGTLTAVEHVSTKGKTPRNFSLDPAGNFLIAANQNTNNIVVFKVDPGTGRLKATGETAEVGSPVCVRFLTAR
jgi:6-phosphogluconolactonase